jgi:esterase/lipase superfamily enzyme
MNTARLVSLALGALLVGCHHAAPPHSPAGEGGFPSASRETTVVERVRGKARGGEIEAGPSTEKRYTIVRVFYGTDRKRTNSREVSRAYGYKRGPLTLGIAEVTVPKDHRLGELEAPSIMKFEFEEDPAKHIILKSVCQLSRDAFIERLKKRVLQSKRKQAFVFVHGYNVAFKDAVRRTAQIAYDLQFDGAPILYSWPSRGSLLGYVADSNNVEWTVPDLTAFLEEVASQSGAKEVHLIAHSMGNRALTAALVSLSRKMGEKQAPIFSQVVLTAPDIDATVFKRQLAPQMKRAAERVTLYASSKDEALIQSKRLNGYPRAGDSGEGIVVVDGVDTIDVSQVDTSLEGHSYYADNSSVISDLKKLLEFGSPPGGRGLMPVRKRKGAGGLKYWVFSR